MIIFSLNREFIVKFRWRGLELECYKIYGKYVLNDLVVFKGLF